MTSGLPKGYKAHRGKKCPVEPSEHVDLIIRTTDGLGHSGVCRASFHDWDTSHHPGGIGAIVGWRLAEPGEPEPHDHRRKRLAGEGSPLLAGHEPTAKQPPTLSFGA